ncbi:DNA-directed DNA polymerase [Methylobacterium gregans]|uniref:DNA polymerase III subunit alpha n=1 Tax=Methylobacterium gregans TaxID=374424 RepID=A0AA37HTG4_9HYPH|nr:DNA polymerase III subunit alpha [Methylobacterium gregans]MDQ0523382.1 DNA polymerase-3 subunit alpha [Methylobacterium gregans]GJD80482.1 DNA polymerase III subunit alpha [Methylobacterium gregans]GLS56023.1 DNA-directed DNA polymerase [Methylobacterium gregans]
MARQLKEVGYVHLHVHSSYSLLEGALKVGDLVKAAAADRQPALALTDTNNLFGALEFSEKAAGTGIQPIAGMQLAVTFEAADPLGRSQVQVTNIVLLAQDEVGYGNLLRLASRAYFDNDLGEAARVRAEALVESAGGLIALTGGPTGPLDTAIRAGQPERARARLAALKAAFGPDNLYVEIQRHGLPDERRVEDALIDLADAEGLSLVAANEPFFAKPDDFDAHDALLAIAEGRVVSDERRRRLTPSHGFKTRAEMAELFRDLPDALQATVEIAMRCAYRVRTRKPILPNFGTVAEEGLAESQKAQEAALAAEATTAVAEAISADEPTELRRQAEAGLEARLEKHGPAPGFTPDQYRERLAFELDVIVKMKFPGYFLIVSDFIKWAKAHDIPVGPGRGSGAGSLVAWSLLITDLDPLRFGLLFERFLNPERVSMPDFDIDFCVEGRERVIQYVQRRYGERQVAQIITFGTLLARGVLRDVGRVLEMPYGQVDKLTKLVPQNPANPVTLAQAIEGEPKLQTAIEEEPVVARLMAHARKLEGLHRHASTHAAGVVIGDRPLEQLVPLYRDPKTGMRVTQFNMKWVEQAGLVKFDFLGLKTLTMLRCCTDLLKQRGIDIDLASLPLDDPKTYGPMGKGETVGVFQVESAGMRKALCEMQCDRLEDIIALVALYRPGPMANIPVYCERKLGRDAGNEANWYPHPMLEPMLKETFGIIVYQEQVMEIAKVLAGYTLGEADMLRRAMGKKIRAEMDAQRERFVKGCTANGLTKAKADEIFDLLAKFADYGFNKSHAAAYALLTYQTAYLKANYPVEFLAAAMTLDIDNTDKLAEFRQDAQRLKIPVDPPSINTSGEVFEVHDGRIRYALAAIKGVGREAVRSIVQARGDTPYKDLACFARRLNPRMVNKRVLESLVQAGALDCIEPDRARAFAAIEPMMKLAQGAAEAESTGITDMFGGVVSDSVSLRIPPHELWPMSDKLKREYAAIGFFVSGHPLDEYGDLLGKLRVQSWADFCRAVRSGTTSVGRVAASVLDRSERRTKTGNKLGIVTLSDQTGHFEAIIFSEGLGHYRDILEPGKPLVLQLQANLEGEDVRARIMTAEPLDAAVARYQKGMRIFLRDERPIPTVQQRLALRGEGEVSLILMLDGAREVEVRLPGKYQATPAIAGALRAVPGVVQVEVN